MLNLKGVFSIDIIAKLQKDSAGIVDIFTKTVSSLKDMNEKIDIEEKQRAEEKARIDAELAKLGALKFDNQKVIEKIGKIFE